MHDYLPEEGLASFVLDLSDILAPYEREAWGAVIPGWPRSASLLGQMELFDEPQSSGGLQNP